MALKLGRVLHVLLRYLEHLSAFTCMTIFSLNDAASEA